MSIRDRPDDFVPESMAGVAVFPIGGTMVRANNDERWSVLLESLKQNRCYSSCAEYEREIL